MFVVTEADVAAIRAAFERGGELSAAVELRRLSRHCRHHAGARVRSDCRLPETAARATLPNVSELPSATAKHGPYPVIRTSRCKATVRGSRSRSQANARHK